MIESRIKRALWTISILIALGFGAHSAYNFYDANTLEVAGQKWNRLNGAWYGANCERIEQRDPYNSCHDAGSMRSFYIHAPGRAREAAADSLAVAIGTPLALWALFFLLRWIWVGGIRNSQPPVSPEKASSGSQTRTSTNWIGRAYTGQVRLWKVFWFGYVAPLLPLSVVFQLYKETADRLPSWVGLVGFLAVFLYQVWLAIALWRCAPNVNRPSLRRLARVFAVFMGLVTLAVALNFLKGTP